MATGRPKGRTMSEWLDSPIGTFDYTEKDCLFNPFGEKAKPESSGNPVTEAIVGKPEEVPHPPKEVKPVSKSEKDPEKVVEKAATKTAEKPSKATKSEKKVKVVDKTPDKAEGKKSEPVKEPVKPETEKE